MGLLLQLGLRRRSAVPLRSARARVRRQRFEQFDRSHDARKLHITEANKRGMGFNGL